MPDSPPVHTVMVVDDEPDIALLLRIVLETDGYRVLSAGSGEEALEILGRDRPDVLLLDLRLPKMDGWGVLQHVRSDPALRELPVVVLSAHAVQEVSRRAAEAKCGFLTKPFRPEEVRRAVEASLPPR